MNQVHMKISGVIAVVLACCFPSFVAADSTADHTPPESLELLSFEGDGYRLEEVPGPVNIPEDFRLVPSPSGKILLYHSNEKCLLYILNDAGLTGPWIYPEGSRYRLRKGYENPYPRWVLGAGGEEVFLLDVEEQRGVALKDGELVPWDTGECSDYPPSWTHDACQAAVRGLSCPMEPILKTFQSVPYITASYPLTVRIKKDDATYVTVELPVEYLRAVSHKRCAAIVYPRNGEWLVLVDFETGVARELNKPRGRLGHAGYSSADFSPDGEWILACFIYGHVSENAGGFLQLYDSNGKHVRELATRSDDTHGAGWSIWLRNGWIYYADEKSEHLLKYEAR